jgi:hypothetical protein
MGLVSTMGGARQKRRAPLEFQDAVELHFRKSGRHANIVWIPEPVCQWQVRITLRPDDPALRSFQAGEAEEEPIETVEITYFDEQTGLYVGHELDELGVSGLVEMLEKGDMWSGQGRFSSIQDAMTWQVETQRSARERLRNAMRDEASAVARDVRKRVLNEPVLPVGISFNESPPDKGPTQENKI